MKKATNAVVTLTAIIGVASLGALYAFDPSVEPKELNAALAFAVFSVFGALMPYSLSERVKGQQRS